ncbi:MAG: RluA family pseudouridine synthase [Solirubrobacteraceae bacterium]
MEIRVPPEAAGGRLDAFLAGPLGSRTRAQRLVADGRVTVDGEPVPKRRMLVGGELVRVEDEPAREPAGPIQSAALAIAYQDEHLLVVDKPAGLVVHPARGNREGTLAQLLAGVARGGEDVTRPGIVHRLDRDTSGLLVVAKTDAAHRALCDALRERRVTRQYLALVEGRPPARRGTIDAPLGRDRRVRTRASTETAEPRQARTHFALERALPASTLLRVSLETGRTHQIRAHFLAIGHPVAGDPSYGTPGLYGLERQFLHAACLAFEHPATGEPVDVASPLPADLAKALERAARAGARTGAQ